MREILSTTLRTLNYGNYDIFLILVAEFVTQKAFSFIRSHIIPKKLGVYSFSH